MAYMSHAIGGFSPKWELTGGPQGYQVRLKQVKSFHRVVERSLEMKAASFVINLGFGLGLALGAVALLLL